MREAANKGGGPVGLDARVLARMVSVPQMLRHLGWRTRNRNRADCGLCKGDSNGTAAFTPRLWRCHRCGEGGDVYTLVRAALRCDFLGALRYVAEVAGVQAPHASRADRQRGIDKRLREPVLIDRAAGWLKENERALRLECCEGIHQCDKVLNTPGPWSEMQWLRAKAAALLRHEYLLPAYALLSFGNAADRTRYVLADVAERSRIAVATFGAGGVRTDSGHWQEVIA